METDRELIKAHDLLNRHAFDCTGVYIEAYRDARASGLQERTAHTHAALKHNRAVRWAYENVNLD